MNNMFYTFYNKHDIGINCFIADEKGTIKNFENCDKNSKIMLSDVKYLLGIGPSVKELNIEIKEEYYDSIFTSSKKSQCYLCLKHYGSYNTIKATYNRLLKYIKFYNKKICGLPMEQYVNGRWNKNCESNYLTIVMIPIEPCK